MKQKKSMMFVLAIGLSIILMIPLTAPRSLVIDWTTESSGNQEIDVNIRTPGCFIENKGQLGNDAIKYYAEIPGGTIGFTEGKVLLWNHESGNVIELSFPGGEEITPQGITPVREYFNYFLGDRGTFTRLRGFETVMFEELWSGIDLVYEVNPAGAKYEFRVAPGADPLDIRVQCEGQDELVVGDVDITIKKDETVFRDVGLLVSQANDNTIQAIYTRYDQQTYGVSVGEYDPSETLVVDPLIFSTYLGGTNGESGYSTTVDQADSIIVAGWTWSGDFPTLAPYNDTKDFSRDCFVSKFNSDGVLLFSTFIGGSGLDFAGGVNLDGAGNIYVVASTESPDFPTTSDVYDETPNGQHDVAVFKLNPAGDTLIFSTFVGGSGQDIAYDLLVKDSTLYVSGYTMSSDIPFTSQFNITAGGGREMLIFRMLIDGSDLEWLNVVRGSGDENAYNIDVDEYDVVTVTGWTDSSDLPTSPTAYQREYGGNTDAFCLAFEHNGNSIYYLTYIGSTGEDMAYGLVSVESANQYVPSECVAYITGSTFSDDFNTTSNAYDRTYNQGGDAFLLKLGPGAQELSFSTYLGGFDEDQGNSILLDSFDNVIVAGRTASLDFPMLHAFDNTNNGGNDLFISKLNYNGQTLISSTYLGGSGDEGMTKALTLDSSGNLIISGGTTSTDFPTAGSPIYDDSHNDDEDVFVTVFTSDFSCPEFSIISRNILTPTNLDTVQVSAVVVDPEGATQVTLQYRTDSVWEDVSMTKISSGSNNWTGSIPAHAVDTVVEYRVLASDAAGNSIVSAIDDYIIVVAPPPVFDPTILIAIGGFAAAVLGVVGGYFKYRAAIIERSVSKEKKKDRSKPDEDGDKVDPVHRESGGDTEDSPDG